MSRITWDNTGERLFETGVEKGVLYPISASGTYPLGVPWNGLTNVTENPSGAESNPMYADNIKYLNLVSNEEFGATIEAYTYPDEFAECDGSAEVENVPGVFVGQQGRKMFGFCYRTLIGNDVDGTDHGYKLHLIYGAQASPSEKAYGTVNDSPEAIQFSWEVSTTPVNVEGFKPTSQITIDSTKYDTTTLKDRLTALETKLYGSDTGTTYVYTKDSEVTSSNWSTKKSSLYIVDAEAEGGYSAVADDASFSDSTDYYTRTAQTGSDPYLPLPDEVFRILSGTNV